MLSRWRLWRGWLALLLLAGLALPAAGQELYALVGAQQTKGLDERTYAFSYEYLQNISEHVFATFTWMNEGHVTDHHRDGHSVQIWGRWLSPSRKLDLSAGIGPYRYYDTTTNGGTDADTTDEHGFGVIYSAAARWYVAHPWVLEVRFNHIHTSGSISTDSVLIGGGYEFDSGARAGPLVPSASYGFSSDERNEVTLMAGKSVLNNFHSPEGAAWGLEYRRRLTPYIDVTGTFLDEGDNGVTQRRGIALSAWLVREFLDHRAVVGLGLGPYVTRDKQDADEQTRVLGLLTMGASWRWTERWATRAYWYRTVTNNGLDTDVVTVGMVYAF